MRNTLLATTCAIALGASMPALAQAQTGGEPMRFGLQLNYGNDSEFGVGGRLRHSLQGLFPSAPVSGILSADIYFPGNSVTFLDFNYNVVYNFRPASTPKLTPYAGAGINLVYVDTPVGSDTRLGLNFVGGTEFRSTSRVTPFVEIHVTIEGADQLVLTGGIKF